MSGTYLSEYNCRKLIVELLGRCETGVIASGPSKDFADLQVALQAYLSKIDEEIDRASDGGV